MWKGRLPMRYFTPPRLSSRGAARALRLWTRSRPHPPPSTSIYAPAYTAYNPPLPSFPTSRTKRGGRLHPTRQDSTTTMHTLGLPTLTFQAITRHCRSKPSLRPRSRRHVSFSAHRVSQVSTRLLPVVLHTTEGTPQAVARDRQTLSIDMAFAISLRDDVATEPAAPAWLLSLGAVCCASNPRQC